MDDYRKLMDRMARERAERNLASRQTDNSDLSKKLKESIAKEMNKDVSIPFFGDSLGGAKKLDKSLQPAPAKPMSPERKGEMLMDSYMGEERRKEEQRQKMMQEKQERLDSGIDEFDSPLSPEEEAEQKRQAEIFIKTKKLLGR